MQDTMNLTRIDSYNFMYKTEYSRETESNRRPRDHSTPTTVSRSTNWAITGLQWIIQDTMNLTRIDSYNFIYKTEHSHEMESNRRPRDHSTPTTVSRSTNWAITGLQWIIQDTMNLTRIDSYNFMYKTEHSHETESNRRPRDHSTPTKVSRSTNWAITGLQWIIQDTMNLTRIDSYNFMYKTEHSRETESNRRPRDYSTPTTVSRSTNWAITGLQWIIQDTMNLTRTDSYNFMYKTEHSRETGVEPPA